MKAGFKMRQLLSLFLVIFWISPCYAGQEENESAQFTYDVKASIRLRMDSFKGVYTDTGQTQSELYLRRADLEISGTLPLKLEYKIETKTDAKAVTTLKTASLEYPINESIGLIFGRFDPDFGLQPTTGSTAGIAIDSSSIWDLADYIADGADSIGIGVRGSRSNFSASASVLNKKDETLSSARVVYAFSPTSSSQLHFGYSYASLQSDSLTGGIKSKLGVNSLSLTELGNSTKMAGSKKVGSFSRDYAQAIEFAYSHKSFLIQSEYLRRTLKGRLSQADRSATGYYLQVSKVLTGESRSYNSSGAKFGRVKPTSSGGAWEVFARQDMLSTQGEPGLLSKGRSVGKAKLFVAGVNWYRSDDLRFSLNLLRANTSTITNDSGQSKGSAVSLQTHARF
jgi:phosphate-selective porin OprO and OprP